MSDLLFVTKTFIILGRGEGVGRMGLRNNKMSDVVTGEAVGGSIVRQSSCMQALVVAQYTNPRLVSPSSSRGACATRPRESVRSGSPSAESPLNAPCLARARTHQARPASDGWESCDGA